jgi:hypothetical protein
MGWVGEMNVNPIQLFSNLATAKSADLIATTEMVEDFLEGS